MPKGLKGKKYPADVIGNAVRVMEIATSKVEKGSEPGNSAAVIFGDRRGGDPNHLCTVLSAMPWDNGMHAEAVQQACRVGVRAVRDGYRRYVTSCAAGTRVAAS
jgi:hypothetical protein